MENTKETPEVVPAGYKRIKFNFKETKVEGKKTGYRRDAVELNIPVPSFADVLEAIKDEPKVVEFIEDAIRDIIYAAAREQINANDNITQDGMDETKLSIRFLATLPPSEKKGAGIGKDTWDEFKADYIAVMSAKTGKPMESIILAADLFANRLQKVKTIKPVLKVLKNELQIWFTSTAQKEEFMEVYEFLDGKAETFLTSDDSKLLSDLGAL